MDCLEDEAKRGRRKLRGMSDLFSSGRESQADALGCKLSWDRLGSGLAAFSPEN
jgi:hypothetical protein